METDQEFFNKPTCRNCGSPHVYPCPYCMPKKEYKTIVRKMKIAKVVVISVHVLMPMYAFKYWRK